MKYTIIIAIFFLMPRIKAQNCQAFKHYGDTLQYEACVIADAAENHYQFSKEYQQIYDQSIEKCNYFSTAYHAKSVAYLKSGDFIEWKRLMDIAVKLKPTEYLGYRGWCRFQFCRDYKGAIEDIEALDSLVNYDIGYSSDGAYHLDVARAVCYKKLGSKSKAISIIESKLKDENYDAGLYDYLHLGVLYLEQRRSADAIAALEKQIVVNSSAEVYYYIALAYKQLGNKDIYTENLQTSKELYSKGAMLEGDYSINIDKIYLNDILDEIENGLNIKRATLNE